MSDDLDDLKAAMTGATPAPDGARRAENLALAQKNFETLQGSAKPLRPTSVIGQNALWTGVKTHAEYTDIKGRIGRHHSTCGLRVSVFDADRAGFVA